MPDYSLDPNKTNASCGGLAGDGKNLIAWLIEIIFG